MLTRPVRKSHTSSIGCRRPSAPTAVAGCSSGAATLDVRPRGDRERARRQQDIQRGGHVQRAAEAQELDEHEPGGESPGGGAEDVRQIEVAERSPAGGAARTADGGHGQRKRGAHAHRVRQQRQGDPAARGEVVARGVPVDTAAGTGQQCRAPGKLRGHGEAREADDELGARVQPQGQRRPLAGLQPAGQPAAAEAAERQPRHEHGQHDGDERRGDTEGRHRQSEPDDLVDEAAEAGHDEEREVPSHPSRVRRARRRTKFEGYWARGDHSA